jgi:hypothetical protein
VFGLVTQWKELFSDGDDLIQSLVRIFGLNHAAYHVDQRIHPRLLHAYASLKRR